MGRSRKAILFKAIAPLMVAVIVLSTVGVLLWSNSAAGGAASTYQQKRQALNAQLRAASQHGYTAQDLEPITSQLKDLDVEREPWWIPGRPGYFNHLTTRVIQLQGQLSTLERQLLQQAQAAAAGQVDSAKAEISQAQQSNAADSDVHGLQQRLDADTTLLGAAHILKDYRAADQQALGVLHDATTLYNATQVENQAVQQAAQQLLSQNSGNLGAIQQAGKQGLSDGRNDASVAAYLNKPSPLKGNDAVQHAYDRLEKFGGMIGSGDVNQAALGAAGVQRYASAIHNALINELPSQTVLVSFQAQHLWAYQKGQVAMDNAVTTGIRGVTDYGTDFGPMKILRKAHPWTFKSPWPKDSPHWYPDTTAQWSTFFTSTGESVHDAYWESDSQLGPGSQYDASTRSHGCIHIPSGKAQWMYDWAQVGTPVVVYPGDGSTVANQLSQITTDNQGNPGSAG